MVYDADTGAFKRMWGAYSNKPLDMDARPPHTNPRQGESCPALCGVCETLQQFAVPRGVDISRDDLVHISDRGNKRIQVFTPEGKFVTEQFVGLDSQYPLQARSTAFSSDERFFYVAGTAVIYILNRKTLQILGSFVSGAAQADSPSHQIAADHEGNIYAVQAELTGADGKGGVAGAYKLVFKGYTPVTKCCQGAAVQARQ